MSQQFGGMVVDWKNGQLLTLVKDQMSQEKFENFEEQVASIQWKLKLSKFHGYHATLVSMQEVSHVEKSVLGVGKDPRLASLAHLIAHVQTLHSIADIFAQIICACFPTVAPTRERDITFYNVSRSLKLSEHASLLSVSKAVELIRENSKFKYVAALVNINKHRVIPIKEFNMDYENNIAQYIVSEFEYDGIVYPSRPATEVLDMYFELEAQYLNIGVEINAVLSKDN
ncbi:hypothetical protein QWZ04_13415 [Vibrio tapetis subsp. quintayensis]|uniref:hypothetical protein n=1 Tax=Vibrio tapetis TaxID=52443 RepID=UPI0025B4A436|nr:hypothetical protein [Vibrio tapetis]MDN3681321.1 hypothetical protein [Vibrio tapetis subsp. quintayensis]